MIKVIRKHVEIEVNETYQTSDGKVFEILGLAEEHERHLEYIAQCSDLRKKLKTTKIPPISCNSLLSNLNIDNTLIWFNNEKEARDYVFVEFVEREALDNEEEEYDYTLYWTGPGYYYRIFNRTMNDDYDIHVMHHYRKFSTDIDTLVNGYNDFINQIKMEERLAVIYD